MNSRKVLRPNFEKRGGLVTVVTQESGSGTILMVAYTNEAGYLETLKTGNAVYWSTSRNERWCKGETSGNYQKVLDILVDCDGDALIYVVEQCGEGACHTKARSCFFRDVTGAEQFPAPGASEKDALPSIEAEVNPSIRLLLCGRS
jgi:phosphoribosyl-AMP cyclohydrolase